jgi:hypothetical protein
MDIAELTGGLTALGRGREPGTLVQRARLSGKAAAVSMS